MPRNRSAPTYVIRVQPEGAAHAERVDVSDRVTALTYVDVEKGTDKLTLTVNNYEYKNFTNPIFADGTLLYFQFGYSDGVMSPAREAVIVKVTGGAVLKVEAHGKAFVLNTERKIRTFLRMKRSEVARQIAEEHGYDGDEVQFIEDTDEVLAIVTQARLTDAMLLRDMAHREGFEFFIDYRGFHFRPRDLAQAPRKLFHYFNDPNEGDILAPPVVENDLTAKPGVITAKGIDPKTKKPIDAKADNDTTKGRQGLGSFVKIHKATGARGERLKRTAQSAVLTTTEKTQASAERHVEGLFRKVQLSAAKLSFPAIGDPLMEAKTLCQIEGIDALSGRYHVTEVSHQLGKDYQMHVKCQSDGVGVPGPAPVKSKAAVNQKPADHSDGPALERARSVDKRTGATKTTFRPKGGHPQ